MVRDYCMEHFVSKGMCCDFAIHDPSPPGHNPHCHVMLTMRAMDEHGKWLPKSRKVYDLDENGERIRLPSGNWKCHKENTVDTNSNCRTDKAFDLLLENFIMTKTKAINSMWLVAFALSIIVKGADLMSNEKLEKLKHDKYVAEKKLTAAKHREKQLESELKRLTRSERTHRLCTRAGMLINRRLPVMILDALYEGQVYPAETVIPQCKEFREAERQISNLLNLLEQRLEKDDCDRLENLKELFFDNHRLDCKENFKHGFAMGVLLMGSVKSYAQN